VRRFEGDGAQKVGISTSILCRGGMGTIVLEHFLEIAAIDHVATSWAFDEVVALVHGPVGRAGGDPRRKRAGAARPLPPHRRQVNRVRRVLRWPCSAIDRPVKRRQASQTM